MGEVGNGHLEGDAVDASEGLVDTEEFFGDGFRCADDEGSSGAAECVVLGAGGRGPATFFADLSEGVGVAGKEDVGGLGVGVAEEADRVDADFELLGVVAGAVAGFAVEVDEGAEAVVLSADDGDHERETEEAGAGERLRSATDAEPDGEGVLEGAGIDALAGEGCTVFAGPVEVGGFADFEEEVEILCEEGVVVLEVEAEEGEGLDEGAAAGDDFCPSVGEQVEGGELLEDADGVGCGEDGDGAGEADALRDGGSGGEDDGGSGVEILGAVMLADAEDVEAGLVGEGDLDEEVAEAIGGGDGEAGGGVSDCSGEAVDTDLHGWGCSCETSGSMRQDGWTIHDPGEGGGLNALFHGLPDELVDLEGEAGGDAVGHHPFDEGAGVEGGIVGGAKGAGGFVEGGGEEDAGDFGGEVVGEDEVAGEVVVGAVGEDEFDFVVLGEGGEIFHAEGVGGGPGSGAFDVDDLVDGGGDFSEGTLAGGLDHEGVAGGEEAVHEREKFAGLEHGFATGELDERAGGYSGAEGFDLGYDFVFGEELAAGEGVLGVAPGTAKIAAGEADEDAGETGEGGLALDGFVELDEVHGGLLVVAGEAGVGLVESAVFDTDAALGHVVELLAGLLVEVFGQVFGRGVDLFVEGWEVVDHEVVEVFHGGAHDLFEELEVEEHAGLVELLADEGDEDLVVVAVGVLALASVVAEVVAGGETGFYGDFKHDASFPSVAACVCFRWELAAGGLSLSFDCIVLWGRRWVG